MPGGTVNRLQKSAQACQRCRSSKRKCDGRRPRCSTCTRRGPATACVFDNVDGRAGRKSREIAALQKRIEDLERHGANRPTAPSTDPQIRPHDSLQGLCSPISLLRAQYPNTDAARHANEGNGTTSFAPREDGQDAMQSPVDGMAAVGADVNPTGTTQFFGNSSTVGFVGQVEAIMDSCISDFSRTACSVASSSSSWPSNTIMENTDYYILPTRAEADELLGIYWDRIHKLYPILDTQSFHREYANLWVSSEAKKSCQYSSAPRHQIPGTRIFHCLLNIMLALGCQSGAQNDRSWDFWQRCKRLLELNFDIFNQASTHLVQALLLMGIYLQGTRLTGACWNLVGVAIRLAQGLGMHLPGGSRHCQGQDEMRSRIWMGCLLMDRTLSVTYGRPLIISLNKSGHLRQFTYSSSRTIGADSELQNITFFHCALQLQTTLANIVSTLYAEKEDLCFPEWKDSQAAMSKDLLLLNGKVDRGDFRDIFQAEQDLQTWEANLPSSLRLQKYPTEWERHAVVLRTRFLYGRILAFRPLLLLQLVCCQPRREQNERESMSTIMRNAVTSHVATSCLQSAGDLISVIAASLAQGDTILPEPCYVIFYAYTASIVLLVGRVCNRLNGHPENEDYFCEKWAESMEALRHYQHTQETARACSQLLQLSEKRFLSQHAGERSPFPSDIFGSQQFGPGNATQYNTCVDALQYETTTGNMSFNWNEMLDMAWLGMAPLDFDFQAPMLSTDQLGL